MAKILDAKPRFSETEKAKFEYTLLHEMQKKTPKVLKTWKNVYTTPTLVCRKTAKYTEKTLTQMGDGFMIVWISNTEPKLCM